MERDTSTWEPSRKIPGVQQKERERAIREVQKYFAQFNDGESWSGELMEDRCAEARREKRG